MFFYSSWIVCFHGFAFYNDLSMTVEPIHHHPRMTHPQSLHSSPTNTAIRSHLSRLVEVVLRLGGVRMHNGSIGRRHKRVRLEHAYSSLLPSIPTLSTHILHVTHSPERHRRRFSHQYPSFRLRIFRLPRRFTGVSVFFGPQSSSIGTCASGFIATASSFPPTSHRS